MYDMYPDWGPAKHRASTDATYPSESARSQDALQASLDLRDNGGQRPDDN
jgi:hypothetical protein